MPNTEFPAYEHDKWKTHDERDDYAEQMRELDDEDERADELDDLEADLDIEEEANIDW